MTKEREHDDAIQKPAVTPKAADLPAAGPHADPKLTNPDATPGAGALPKEGEDDPNDAGATG